MRFYCELIAEFNVIETNLLGTVLRFGDRTLLNFIDLEAVTVAVVI